ncbi:MAG: carboxymuconolactone decarboxylase family protein [Nevskiales bacterium]|nr:carboxymuconolactone decarboxylase family protein [Nevskiales bacterium]
MPYIAPLDPNAADATTAATLQAVKAAVGMVPNLYATLALAPAALNGLLQLNEAIGGGQLSAKEREIVALAASQANGCGYCLSAHTLLGKNAGLSLDQTLAARAGLGSTPREAAIAACAKAVVDARGHVGTAMLDRFKSDGLSNGDLMEIVANVAATTLTNYVNNVARTEIDFPAVDIALAA